MAAALPVTKGQYESLEGTPTLGGPDDVSNIIPNIPPPPPPPNGNASALVPPPPPPDVHNRKAFDFDQWLDTNNLSQFKQLFIKHKMTTFDSINTSHTNFALLLSEQQIIQSNTLSSLVMSIQKLHFDPDTLPSKQQAEPATDTYDTPPIPAETENSGSMDNKQYIVVSQDEHQVLTNLKHSLNEVKNIKSQLTEIQNNYTLNKNKVENNKKIYIEKCKEKINTTFWNMIQIIKNRQQYLLKHIDEIYLNHLNGNSNGVDIQLNFNDIVNEINHHEKYIHNQMEQCNDLIQRQS